MRCCFVLCLAIVYIVRANPVPQDVTDVDDDDDMTLNSTDDDSTDSSDTEYARCGPNTLNDVSSENLNPNQSANIFRRQTSGSFCGLQRPNSPFKHFDPTKLKPQPIYQDTTKSRDPCADYPDTRLGTCQGPEVSPLTPTGFRRVVNCIQGKFLFFQNSNAIQILNNN